jgi:glycosyltransferase involved in cell wall biosynthesis
MARLAVVTSTPPGAEGGHMVIVRALAQALRDYGHDADIVTTPSYPFGSQAREYWAAWRTNVQDIAGRRIDRVITTRYPAWAVRHPDQVCWNIHTMREYYDLWERFSGGLSPQGRLKESVRRQLIHTADSYCFAFHVRRMYAISKTIQARLQRWNHTTSEVLYPPPPPRAYRCDAYEPFLFVVSRLVPLKRIDLLLDALAQPRAHGIHCVIAGEGDAAAALGDRARALGLESRVRFVGRISDAELVDYLARCRAVAFVPLQEDYGFVTAEACASGKAVITTLDSGGPAELIADRVSGRVTAPNAAALADAIAEVMDDETTAVRLGAGARAVADTMSWHTVAATLAASL